MANEEVRSGVDQQIERPLEDRIKDKDNLIAMLKETLVINGRKIAAMERGSLRFIASHMIVNACSETRIFERILAASGDGLAGDQHQYLKDIDKDFRVIVKHAIAMADIAAKRLSTAESDQLNNEKKA